REDRQPAGHRPEPGRDRADTGPSRRNAAAAGDDGDDRSRKVRHDADSPVSAARLRLAPVGETMFSPRPPFFAVRLGLRAAEIAAQPEERSRGNLPVSREAPSPAHGP